MKIDEFLSGIPANAVLRERVALLLEDKQRLKEKVEALEKEKVDVLREIGSLRAELVRYRTPPDTVKHRGVFFKGVSKGEHGVQIDCAVCDVPLSTSPDMQKQFMCHKCGFIAWFNRGGLAHLLAGLPKS